MKTKQMSLPDLLHSFPPEHFTAFIFKPINFNWNTIHMFLIHLHLFHQIVLQETFDVSQVFFSFFPQKEDMFFQWK